MYSVSKKLKDNLENDESYIQYFCEEMYGFENIRHSSFSACYRLLKNQMQTPIFKRGVDY